MGAQLKFTSKHEWVLLEGDDVAVVGITEYARDALGDLVMVELPEIGRHVEKGQDFAVVESVKTAAEVYTPVGGEVIAVNDELLNDPDMIKRSVIEGWIAKIKIADKAFLDELMDEPTYKKFCQEQDH